MHTDPDPTAELPQHFAALRRLARELVGADDADDVVQEVVVQALRTPPRRPGPLGGWLAEVLRHVASHHRRAAGRRTRHEAAAGALRAERVAGSPAAGPDVEILQALTAALAALPEPYRTAVWARYLQDRSPAAIAAASGEPVATVKTRCKRGLQMLRERLAATPHRRDWRRALVGAFALEPAVASAAGTAAAANVAHAATGGLMATAATWWIGGVVGCAIVGSLLWWPEPTAPPRSAAAAETPAGAVGAAATADVATEPVAPAEAPRTEARASAAASAMATLVGRCVADTGAPLAGVTLRLSGRLRLGVDAPADEARVASYHDWLAAHPDAPWRPQAAATGDDGTFTLEAAAAPVAARLLLVHDGIDHELDLPPLVAGERIDVGDLQLARACHVAVQAIDETGAAVPTAPIRLLREARARPALPAPRLRQPHEHLASTADGAVATVTAGTWRVDVLGHDVVRGAQCVVPPQVSTFAHTVVVATPTSPDTIQGTVVDLHDQPIADVEIVAIPGNVFARTAPDGRFVLPRLPLASARVQLSLHRKGWSLAKGLLRARWGDRDLRFVMEPTTTLRLHVVDDATGAPLPDVTVWRWLDPSHPPLGDVATRGGQVAEHADATGEVVLHDVPRGHHLLVVEPNGTAHARSDAVPILVAPPHEGTVEIRLRAAAARTLHVHTAGGEPVADAGVELLVADAPSSPVTASTISTSLASWDPKHLPFAHVRLQRGRTDAAGTFGLRGPGDRHVAVRVSPPGHPPFVIGPVSLTDPEPLRAEVPGGVAVELTVGPAAFVRAFTEPPEAVAFGAPPPPPGFRLRRGEGRDVVSVPAAGEPPMPLAADGKLSFPSVPPGPWSLELQWIERSAGQATFAHPMRAVVAAVVVPSGRDLDTAVDLAAWLPVSMHATVLRAGQPLANTMVTLTVVRPDLAGTGTLRISVPAITDAAGRFRFRGRPGTATVAVDVRDPGAAATSLRSREELLLPGDRREVTFVLE